MAENIVAGLFGLTPQVIEQQQLKRGQDLGGLFAAATMNPYATPSVQNAYLAQQGAQFALGDLGARKLGGLFGIQDPELKKAAAFESILAETQQELGPEGLQNPELLYGTLASKLANAGLQREATMIAMEGQKAIQDYRLSGAKMATEQAQLAKAQQEKQPEIVRLQQARLAAIEAGDLETAAVIEAQIVKNTNIPERNMTPENQAEQAILNQFVNEAGGDVASGSMKFAQWKNKEKERVASASAGKTVVQVATGKAEDEFAKAVGKNSAERQIALVTSAETAPDNLAKIDRTLDELAKGKARTGLFAEYINNVDRAVALLGGREAAEKVEATELIDAMLGSEVFPQIGALGIGARGLDTPNEREFLRKVVAGTITMNEATIKRMLEIRRNLEKRNLDKYNESLDRGDLDAYFTYSKQPKRRIEDPNTTIVNGKEFRRPAGMTNEQWLRYKQEVGAK